MQVAQVTPLAQAHPKETTAARVKVSKEFQKRQAVAVVLALLAKTMQVVASLAMAVLALQVVSAAHLSTMLVAVVVAAIDRVGLLEVLEVAVLEGFIPAIKVARRVLQTQVAVAVAQMLLQQRRQAAQA